jgi:chromosome segregation ATPase
MEELHKHVDLLQQELEMERELAFKYYSLCSTLTYAVDEKKIELELEQKARLEAHDDLVEQKARLEADLARERAANESTIGELAAQLAQLEAQHRASHESMETAEVARWRDECASVKRALELAREEAQDLELERDLAREESERLRNANEISGFEVAEKTVLIEFAEKERAELAAQVATLKAAIDETTEQHQRREQELSAQLAAVEQRLEEVRKELAAERDARGEEQRIHAALRYQPASLCHACVVPV